MSAFKDLHEEWETISACKVNTARSMATLVFAMADSKKSVEQDVAKLPREDRYMYSDRSSFKANIGIRGGCVDAQTVPKGKYCNGSCKDVLGGRWHGSLGHLSMST